jgi:hypothetical protein
MVLCEEEKSRREVGRARNIVEWLEMGIILSPVMPLLAPSTSVRLDLQREGAQWVFVVKVDNCFSPNLLFLLKIPRPDINDKHHQDPARNETRRSKHFHLSCLRARHTTLQQLNEAGYFIGLVAAILPTSTC